MQERRVIGVDFMRASACLLVVASHLQSRIDHASVPAGLRPLFGFASFGGYGVAIFFVLSGYLLSRPFWAALDAGAPLPSLRTYALRRAARILPGYWLALVVTFILCVTVFGLAADGPLTTRVVAGFFLVSDWHWLTLFPVEHNGPLWSISFEVTSYILLPLAFAALLWLGRRGLAGVRLRLAWLGVIAVTLLVHLLIVRFAPIDDVNRGWQYGDVGGAKEWMPRFNAIGFFAIFAIGAMAAGVQTLIPATARSWLADAIAAAALAILARWMVGGTPGIVEGYSAFGLPYAFPIYPLAAAVFLVAVPSSRLAGRLADNPASRAIARISFGIYLWHYLVIELMARLLPPAFDPAAANAWQVWLWSSAAALALSIAIATASYHFLERPVVTWARTRETQPSERGAATLSPSAG